MAYVGNTPVTQGFIPAVDYFNGNGSTTAFTLSRSVASVAQVQAVIDNVPQNPGSAFTVSGNTVTFTSAPPSGTSNIYVYYTSPITQVIAPGQGTVGVSQLSATGTPSASTFLRGDNSWASAGFPSGTLMLFVQTAAPTGWTKSTSHDNKALRVVSGTAGTGGSVAFTTAFASQTPAGSVSVSGGGVSATTLAESQIPSHWHYIANNGRRNVASTTYAGWYGQPGTDYDLGSNNGNAPSIGYSSNTGGGGSHTHGFTTPTASFTGSAINLAVQYVDVIVATKD